MAGNWIPPLKVTPHRFEAAHGIVLRLCERNGLTGMHQFEVATGMKIGHVFAGRHLETLGAILNLPEEEMRNRAFRIQAGQPTLVAGVEVRPFDISRKMRRVCTLCLRENPYQQFWWDLNFITHCPTHSVELVSKCPCGRPLSWRDREISRCRECRSGSVTDTEPVLISSPRSFERWALSKFGVWQEKFDVTLLDAMQIKDAIALVTRIGSLDEAGWALFWLATSTRVEKLHDFQEAGYGIIKTDGLLSLFDRVHKQSEALLGSPPKTMQASLGWFWSWFTRAGAVGLSTELAQTLARHFDNHFVLNRYRQYVPRSPLANAGPLILTIPAPVPVPGTLELLLHDPESRTEGSDGKGPDNPLQGAEWVIAASDVIEAREAQAFLGIGPIEWNFLLVTRCLPFHVTPLSQTNGKSLKLMSRTSLTEWIEGIAQEAPVMERCPPGCSSVAGPDGMRYVNFVRLIKRIICREVAIVGRLSSTTGLASLIVNNDN